MRFSALLLAATAAHAAISVGPLEPGRSIDLNGTWQYRPSFQETYVLVPVPQMLSRIQWWLDDSEDFKAWENARLKKLGFDTERAEDGWYRLELNVPSVPADRHLFIEFDGVAMKCKAFLNGQVLGEHTGMFSRFAFDLTPHLRVGNNELTVFVSMEKITVSSHPMSEAVTVNLTASKVMTLSKGMFGPLTPNRPNREYDLHGIWQPVRLVVRGDAQIDDAWFVPSLNGAEVRVEAHGIGKPLDGTVEAEWTDLFTGRRFALAPPQAARDSTILKLSGVHPKLWTPADPNLYRLDVRLKSKDGKLLDQVTKKVGFRTFEIRGNQLYLNGHPYWLRGANQLPYGKNPWDPQLPRKLIRFMHDNNLRITRTHATPWNEAWLDAADEIGLGVSIEGIRPWALAGLIGPPPRDIFEHWLMENADVVKRIRNHPSVLIWTVGNEMMLRDSKSIEKWKLLSDVVKQTRKLDPYRPVIASSEYTRDPEFYNSTLKPNGIDDGDIDDIHRYRGWYAESPFVTHSRFETEMKRNRGERPFIGQEMSSGYPDLDTGLPVLRYTRDMVTPQAWVGEYATPGHDPAIFLEHDRAVSKRWAEQLRWERGKQTSGFLLFSAECWFRHSYDAATATPYPVVGAMREAWAPLGLAVESSRRRFFSGESLETAVFATNDDEQFRDHAGLQIEVTAGPSRSTAPVGKLPYYATARIPVQIRMPPVSNGRGKFRLIVRLLENGKEISRTEDPIEVFAPLPIPELKPVDLKSALTRAEAGESVLVMSPGKELATLLPKDVKDVRNTTGEFADWTPATGTTLAKDLQPMDIKWWGRPNDGRVFVASSAHRLLPGGKARSLVRFIPAHSYIPAERVPDQIMSVLFEIPVGKGKLVVCDLDVLQAAAVDPAARLFARNLASFLSTGR